MSRFTLALRNLLPIIRYSHNHPKILYDARERGVIMKVGLNRSTGTLPRHTAELHSDRRIRRHESRHNKEHVCKVPDCSRTEGFANLHDLMRHQKSVHKIRPQHGRHKEYKCFGGSCAKPDKEWPRLDNFKQNLKRMHTHENAEMLITK
jgi:hypothetical protein